MRENEREQDEVCMLFKIVSPKVSHIVFTHIPVMNMSLLAMLVQSRLEKYRVSVWGVALQR